MQYKEIMTSNNMHDALMILADKCREKDKEIAELKDSLLGEEVTLTAKIGDIRIPLKTKVRRKKK